jgi:hypothetical protein
MVGFDLEYRKTPDRIRQRALENMGYSVYRVRAGRIVDRYYQIMEVEGEGEAKDREKIPLQK